MNMHAKILIVDDDPVIVAATRRILESAGYETLSAQDGQEALSVTHAQRPDLVLLDVSMPGMDGFEVCRQIKADPALAGTFIIIISSTRTDSDSHANGLNMGADGYISRPIANRELLARVQAMLRIQAGERALLASNAQWSATFDAVSDAIFLTDAEYTILKCNQAAAEMWQHPLEALVGRKCYQVVHGAEAPASACPLAMVCETRSRQVLTFTQNERWLEAKVDPMFDAAGNFSGTVHVIEDITERKQADEALQASENRFRALIESSSDAITLLDANGIAVYDSPAAPGMLGYTPEDWIGRDVFALLHPNDLSKMQELFQNLVKKPGARVNSTFRVQHKGGEWLWIEMVATNLLSEPDVQAIVLNYHDISERKQADQALRESEDKFKYVFDHSVSGKSITLVTGEINVNQAFGEMLGYSQEELQSRRWQDISHPDDLELTQTEINALLSDQRESTRFVKRYLHKNGSTIWTEVGTTLRRDEEGKPLYFLTSINDITERKRAEDALRESEGKYRRLFENTSLGVFQSSPEGKAISINQAFARMFGYDFPAEALRNIQNVATDVFADPNRRAEIIRLMAENPDLKTFENIYRRKDGSTFIGSLNLIPVKDSHGRLIRLEGLIEDITERKQAENTLRKSEEKFRKAFVTSPDSVNINRLQDGMYISINPGFTQIMGYTEADVIGKTSLELQIWEDPEDRNRLVEGLKKDGFVNNLETCFRRKDGGTKYGLMSASLIEFDGIPHIISITRDITERRQAEEKIRSLNAELEEKVKARTRELLETQEQLVRQEKLAVLGQLAGSVGHELRNPLGIINNAIYYLRMVQPEADETIKEYFGIIETETHTADKIISDLLDFSRIKSVDVEPVVVSDLFQRTLERFPAPKSVQVTLMLSENLPAVYVDPRQMTQVFGNLVLNACQSMSKGGKLTLSARKKGKMVVIVVADTGVGIPPENMQKLFEPLFTTKSKGIGLGLAVSKKLVEANGGRIEVESEVGVGTTFTVFLPIHQPDEQAPDKPGLTD